MTVLLTEVVNNGVRSLIGYLNWLSRGILLEGSEFCVVMQISMKIENLCTCEHDGFHAW